MVAKKGGERAVASSVAFPKAVKHLFKHLHDARALSRNLLVRHIFDDTSIAGTGATRDRAVLSRVLQLVRQGADYCRDADLMAGNRERGLRQHAIITLQCLDQRPIQQVAAELEISNNYCYRERADICRRVALYVCEHSDLPAALDHVAELDHFHLRLDSILRNAKTIDKNRTLRACEDLISSAPSPRDKVEALCAIASLSLDFEDPRRASTAISSANGLCDKHMPQSPSPSWDSAKARASLMGSKVANYRGNMSRATRLAEEAVQRLQPIQANASVSVKELYTETLYELGGTLWNTGNLERGYDVMTEAEATLRYVRSTSIELRTQVMSVIWKMRNRLLLNPTAWHPLWQRLRGLASTFEIAYGGGLMFQAAEALVGLTELHVFAGNESDALRTGQLAVSLAKELPTPTLQAKIVIDVATRLQWTRHREYAMSLVSVAERLNANDAYCSESLTCVAIERALMLRNFRGAWEIANASRETSYSHLSLRRLAMAATAAHALGWQRRARAIIEKVIPKCEALGDARLLSEVYQRGANITGSARLSRLAKKLADLLAA
jgi:hypothetical protein